MLPELVCAIRNQTKYEGMMAWRKVDQLLLTAHIFLDLCWSYSKRVAIGPENFMARVLLIALYNSKTVPLV